MNPKKFPYIKDEMLIETVRNQMVETAMKKGLNHPSTLKLSQQLDGLLNGYNRKSHKQPTNLYRKYYKF